MQVSFKNYFNTDHLGSDKQRKDKHLLIQALANARAIFLNATLFLYHYKDEWYKKCI